MLAAQQGRGADAADGARMNHWPFVIAAYAVTLGGDGGAGRWSAGSAMRRPRRARRHVKPKHQRLTLALLALAAVVGAAAARAVGAQGSGGVLLRARRRRSARACRRARRCGWAGWSQAGSIKRAARRRHRSASSSPTARDGAGDVPRHRRPICSRRIRAWWPRGSSSADGSFVATNLLAKHDERYMPPQVAGKMHETKTLERP